MFLDFYKCYSISLKRFLSVHGVHFISKGQHDVTKRKYWIYEKNDRLSELLTAYSETYKQKGEKNE